MNNKQITCFFKEDKNAFAHKRPQSQSVTCKPIVGTGQHRIQLVYIYNTFKICLEDIVSQMIEQYLPILHFTLPGEIGNILACFMKLRRDN